MGALDLKQLPYATGADLSPDAIRQRAFARECELIALRARVKADRRRARAARLPINSNGRRKLEREAARLDEHAETMRTASR